MFKKNLLLALTMIVLAAMLLSACGGATTPEATEPAETAEPVQPAEKLAVGIVLPTKDEPRWIQDETRFREALEAAG
ncbi:MAG: sugar ABC transporter substrate-binding protein, partial [Anaerolineae bacterium]|nr:sugar ABC transporter substrate-binding protein [Anaerolineae bacterium]